jgi:hypothetical protein
MTIGISAALAITLAVFPGSALAQRPQSTTVPETPLETLSVCEALRNLKHLNGRMVAVRGAFHYSHRHGGWLLDQHLKGDPCANMSRKSRIWWSAIWLGALRDPNLEGGPVHFEEEPPTYSDLIQRLDKAERNKENQTFTVTLIG